MYASSIALYCLTDSSCLHWAKRIEGTALECTAHQVNQIRKHSKHLCNVYTNTQ